MNTFLDLAKKTKADREQLRDLLRRANSSRTRSEAVLFSQRDEKSRVVGTGDFYAARHKQGRKKTGYFLDTLLREEIPWRFEMNEYIKFRKKKKKERAEA